VVGNKILIVDDVEINREMLCEILKDEYEVIQAENGCQALEILEKDSSEYALVLLDLIMPRMDGFGVLAEMDKRKWLSKIPVLIISGEIGVETEERCFECGVSDFIRKPYNNEIVRKRVQNIVELFQYKNRLEEKVEQQTVILRRQMERLRRNNVELIETLGTVVESRNLESGEHIRRVKGFSRILADEMKELYPEYGLTEETVEMIENASALHDVGKIAIPDYILLKPGRLSDEEFECMKSHSVKGSELLRKIKGIWDEKYSKISYDICRFHHERYDGRGYPDHLRGDEIPVSAQIVSLADVYDALISDRVYKSAYTKGQAYDMITGGKCGIFSPKLLACFEKARQKMELLADEQKNQEKFDPLGI